MTTATANQPETVTSHLRPIDRDGLLAFAEKGRNNPAIRGTNKVHVFKGWTEMVNKPKNGPAWLPAKIKKANVSKSGTKRL